MKDKEKQIEEMAMIMCENNCEECRRESIEFYGNSYDEDTQCLFNAGAERLYNEGYRKIPKDSVVLSREEQEQMNNELRDKVYQACKLEKQKTAEKIINHFVAEFPFLKTRVIARELAKQYGVEIKESTNG